jgi:hypothetical protein
MMQRSLYETIIREVHREESNVERSQDTLLKEISMYISGATNVQLVIMGKSVYVRGAVAAAYACSESNLTLEAMSTAIFRSGANCPMLDPQWWIRASHEGMISFNAEPIRVENASPKLLDAMSNAMISGAMSRCNIAPHIIIVGSHNSRKLDLIKAVMRRWRPQCTISRCEQPTVTIRRKSNWRPTIDMLSNLVELFGCSELDSDIMDATNESSSDIVGFNSKQKVRVERNESDHSDDDLMDAPTDELRVSAEDDSGYISE